MVVGICIVDVCLVQDQYPPCLFALYFALDPILVMRVGRHILIGGDRSSR